MIWIDLKLFPGLSKEIRKEKLRKIGFKDQDLKLLLDHIGKKEKKRLMKICYIKN